MRRTLAMVSAVGLLAAPCAAAASPSVGPAMAAPAHAAQARADVPPADPGAARLAYRRLDGAAVAGRDAGRTAPGLVLAQRTIYRDWGPSDDSIYVEIDVPAWKSEPLAAAFSAAAPGAGQLYVGQRSGFLYAALEVAGWGGWWWYRRDARRLRDEAAGVAGAPAEAASGWSLERWSAATESDPAEIATLYATDREAFYNAITTDPRYLAGWSDEEARGRFGSLRIRADQRLRRSRIYGAGVWLNHLVAAVDALRAARLHNLPLADEYSLRIDGRLRHGRGSLAVALERKF